MNNVSVYYRKEDNSVGEFSAEIKESLSKRSLNSLIKQVAALLDISGEVFKKPILVAIPGGKQ